MARARPPFGASPLRGNRFTMMSLQTLNWIGSLTGMVGAVMVAINAGYRVTGYGFGVFSFSAAVWIISGLLQGESALTVQYLVLLAINLFGVYRWLVLKPAAASAD